MSASCQAAPKHSWLRAAESGWCPRCGADTFRYAFHWTSAVRCDRCTEKIEECRCAP